MKNELKLETKISEGKINGTNYIITRIPKLYVISINNLRLKLNTELIRTLWNIIGNIQKEIKKVLHLLKETGCL